MDSYSSEGLDGRLRYAKDDTFDIKVGMTVSDAGGRKIGKVKEVAGFGSTHVHGESRVGTVEDQIAARSATGYIMVDRREVLGRRDAVTLCVPFHGILSVTREHGVVLNHTALSELHDQAKHISLAAIEVPRTQQGGWHTWLRSRRS